jgi:hypothetical protein
MTRKVQWQVGGGASGTVWTRRVHRGALCSAWSLQQAWCHEQRRAGTGKIHRRRATACARDMPPGAAGSRGGKGRVGCQFRCFGCQVLRKNGVGFVRSDCSDLPATLSSMQHMAPWIGGMHACFFARDACRAWTATECDCCCLAAAAAGCRRLFNHDRVVT